MNKIKLFHIISRAVFTLFSSGLNASNKAYINSDWYFIKGDVPDSLNTGILVSNWQKGELPYTFVPLGDKNHWLKKNVFYRGVAWYAKTLFVKSDLKDRRLFLNFDGVYLDVDVYLNGKKFGNHKSGFTC